MRQVDLITEVAGPFLAGLVPLIPDVSLEQFYNYHRLQLYHLHTSISPTPVHPKSQSTVWGWQVACGAGSGVGWDTACGTGTELVLSTKKFHLFVFPNPSPTLPLSTGYISGQ